MYLQRNKKQGRKNNFPKALLVESYWDSNLKKTRKRTVLNLSSFPDETIDALELALKHSSNLSSFKSIKDIKISSGIQFAPQLVVHELIKSSGIQKALGNSYQAKLAIWQIIARVIQQGSRLSAVRLARDTASDEILNFGKSFCEDSLYRNLLWLADNQEEIENKLFANRSNSSSNLFLYDVTSSYLEGECNELATYGYNRDKKKGKKQIVIGLLTDSEGFPISIEVFYGNTSDPKTMNSQIEKISSRFNCQGITIVGDKGMIKSAGIESLKEAGFNYITTITKPQIEGLIERGVIQISLFDNELVEIEEEGIRYILRKNSIRAEELQKNRLMREERFVEILELENKKKKARIEDKIERLENKLERLKIKEWTELKVEEGNIIIEIDEEKRKEAGKLDGCFVLKTDLGREIVKEAIHERYKDLALVENAFRSMKTVELEMRPIYVIKSASTRGHLLIVMLAYMVMKELESKWKEIDLSVSEGIDLLKGYSTVQIEALKGKLHRIPEPEGMIKTLIEALGIEIPKILPAKRINILTRKTLSKNA